MASQRDEDYIKFLQDQVRRQNAVLQEYQKKYLPVKDPDVKEDEPLPPWITNSSILSPLLVEYDDNIKALEEQINYYKQELTSLKHKADKVVEENTRLHGELRRSIEAQMDAARHGEGESLPALSREMMDNMQQQLQLLTQEKDSYVEMWQNAAQELEKIQDLGRDKSEELRQKTADVITLQHNLQKARQVAEELQAVNRKLRMEHEKFLSTAQTQDQEIDGIRSELRRYKAEWKTSRAQNEELRKSLEMLQNQIKVRDKERDEGFDRERSSDSRLEELQTFVIELQSRISATLKEVGRLRSDKAELEDQLAVLQQKSSEQGQRELEAMSHVRDSVQMVENAILERDQAAVREQQKAQEVCRLQEVINKLLREAGKRTREEVDSVRSQYNQNLQKLMEEMQYLEMEGAEKQAQLERSLREKAAVEKELEKVYQEGPSEIARTGLTFDELQTRISQAERRRDEAAMRGDELASSLKRIQAKREQEKTQATTENDELRKKCKQLMKECEETAENRLQLVDEIDKLKREVLQAKQAKEAAERDRDTEVAALEQRHQVRERDFDNRLHHVEGMHRQSVGELRDMLNAQQRAGAQWKEESRSLTSKFEQTVAELRQEIAKEKRRNDELSSKLGEEKQDKEEIEKKLVSRQQQQEKLQQMAADAETRADAASTQVSTLLTRERQLLQERKLLTRELDKLKLEKSRPSGIRIREPPQRLSDLLTTSSAGVPTHEPAVRLDMMSPRGDERFLRELDGVGSRPFANGYGEGRLVS